MNTENVIKFLKENYPDRLREAGEDRVILMAEHILEEKKFNSDEILSKEKKGRHWLDVENLEFLGDVIDYLRLGWDMYKYNRSQNKETSNTQDDSASKSNLGEDIEEIKERYKSLSDEDKMKVKKWIRDNEKDN